MRNSEIWFQYSSLKGLDVRMHILRLVSIVIPQLAANPISVLYREYRCQLRINVFLPNLLARKEAQIKLGYNI